MAYTLQELAALWRQAGGPSRAARMMAAIALAESGGDPHAVDHDADGTVDRGLWQINSVHGYPASQSFNPLDNAREAVAVWRSSGPGAWSTYKSGAYQKYMAGKAQPSRPRWGVISPGSYDGTDQGVDFKAAGPVPALDAGVVTDITSATIRETGNREWPVVVYRLTAGPYKGRYVYVAENFKPRVQRGQKLGQGDPIGTAPGAYPFIEYGFNQTATGWNAYGNESGAQPQGQEMWAYMQKLISGQTPIGPDVPGAPAPTVDPAAVPQPSSSGGGISHGAAVAEQTASVGGTLVDSWQSGFGGGGLFGFLGDVSGLGDVTDFLKASLWLVNPMNWLRLFELLVGAVFMLLSLVGLGVMLASRSEVVKEAAGVARQVPGPVGVAGRTVTTASQVRSPQVRRRVVAERIPERVATRAATQQGEREERRSQRNARIAAARSSGRRRVQAARTRERADRFGEVPF